MVALFRRTSLALLAASVASASPLLETSTLVARGTIDSDKVVGFPQTVPSGITGEVYLAYKPYLKVVNGCVPFPAVDAEGNTNAGLKPTGASDGQCSSSTGQVYSRAASYNGNYAVMYSWYMPKDEPSDGLGHRHDWEGVIVWLASGTSTSASNILAVCPSAHGKWDCSTDGYTLSGTQPLIKYESIWPLDHSCGLTTTVGGLQPLISWEELPAVAQQALDTTDFGAGNVPFNDNNFLSNLGQATF
ncbi:NPP1 domain protein, putative [Talaromyces stipitatus ATCC 10500]|uniref:NPP1 domain protein, putative n=1 Tax=Talaromyces stipitatus (strain ATCC 10500 / CBS 375.48 / QM 6759 / NRRL 1006) TaxID=441959 RepID=B8LTV2_TALSN|nr:NPP1 domain protein, putative [Talaromyces stipitatus ATCC 10500]EED23782.1 NPP1 domain protein, putative [Talaromyces stipitatus ATCC 10500]